MNEELLQKLKKLHKEANESLVMDDWDSGWRDGMNHAVNAILLLTNTLEEMNTLRDQWNKELNKDE